MKKMSSRRLVSLGLLTLAFSAFETACTDDEKKAEETVQAEAEAAPAEPASDVTEPPAAPLADLSGEAIYFAFDYSSLNGDSQSTLGKVAEAMKADAAMKLTVEGHTDERCSTEYNLALGERRANAVKSYLINLGIDAGRLSTVSLGEERPVEEGKSEEAWSKNRRAVFVNISH